MPASRDALRRLPQIDALVRAATTADATLPGPVLVKAARSVLDGWRRRLLAGAESELPATAALVSETVARAATWVRPRQCRVINATGVVLHTNLGRAVLSRSVLEDVFARLSGYSLLEVERDSGRRTKRDFLVTDLLTEITGAEAATVVNNNAAATHLILHTLAAGREAICSHAHLVGIGGSYRMPDVMRAAGVDLRTIGATNHCLAADYESGINERTGLLLMVHTSNYQVVGFTKYATLEELVAIGRKHGVPVVYDLGAGALVDLSRYGFHGHSVAELVAAGPDLVCFSGDKLLGGPQAGIIVGSRDAVDACRKSPFYRMMRPDKMTLALLEATLRVYLNPEVVDRELPVLRMIGGTLQELRPAAEQLATRIRETGVAAALEVFEDVSEIGGGSLSNQHMPTCCVGVRPANVSVQDAAAQLRMGEPSVFVRVKDGRLVFDVRTLLDGEAEEAAAALAAALTEPPPR